MMHQARWRLIAYGGTLWLFFLGLPSPLFTQSAIPAPPTLMVLKTNPLSFIVEGFNVQVERSFGARFSGQIGLMAASPSLTIHAESLPEPIHYTILGLTPEFRYYFTFLKRPAPRGPYLASYLRLQHVQQRYQILALDPDRGENIPVDAAVTRHVLAGGFLVGCQLLIKRRFSIDGFMGPRYGRSFSNYRYSCQGCNGDERPIAKPGLPFQGIELRAGICIGYAF
jgi:Protein of unknown function (DUF3575)